MTPGWRSTRKRVHPPWPSGTPLWTLGLWLLHQEREELQSSLSIEFCLRDESWDWVGGQWPGGSGEKEAEGRGEGAPFCPSLSTPGSGLCCVSFSRSLSSFSDQLPGVRDLGLLLLSGPCLALGGWREHLLVHPSCVKRTLATRLKPCEISLQVAHAEGQWYFASLTAVSWERVSNCAGDHYGDNQGPLEGQGSARELYGGWSPQAGDLKMKYNVAPSNF